MADEILDDISKAVSRRRFIKTVVAEQSALQYLGAK
jgi:hypothetical protein